MSKTSARPPAGLGPSGRSIWTQVTRAVPDDCELDELELICLRLAAKQADECHELEKIIKEEGAHHRWQSRSVAIAPGSN